MVDNVHGVANAHFAENEHNKQKINLLRNERNLLGMFPQFYLTYPESLVKIYQLELELLRVEVSISKR